MFVSLRPRSESEVSISALIVMKPNLKNFDSAKQNFKHFSSESERSERLSDSHKFFLIYIKKNFDSMKKGIHPESYRLVAFKDMSNDHVFLTRSCANTKETIEIDGVEYPVVKVEISNTSHPFYTGKMKLVDTAGRVDKFYNRYGKRNQK